MSVARLLAILPVSALCSDVPVRASIKSDSTSTVDLSKASGGLGVRLGSSVLTPEDGTEPPLKDSSGTFMTAGDTKTGGKSTAFGLGKVKDFIVNFGRLGAGGSVVVGKEVAVPENEATPITIHLSADHRSAELDAGSGGPDFTLKT